MLRELKTVDGKSTNKVNQRNTAILYKTHEYN